MKIQSVRRAVAALAFASVISLSLLSCSKESDASPAPKTPTPAKSSADADAKKTGDPVKAAETKMGAGPKKLRFSAIPNINSTEMLEANRVLATYLSKKLGVDVEFVPVADYNASVDAFKTGDLDLCWFGGYTGCQARDAVAGAKAIVCGARDKKFKSYFIANKSMGWVKKDEFPMQIKGHKFTFGSPQSTSGRLMPEYYIRLNSRETVKDFFNAEPSFSGTHDKTIDLVAAGTFECGVVDYTVYEKRLKEGKLDPKVVEVIWETPEFFDYQFTVRPDLDQRFGANFTQKLQDVLISIKGDDLVVLKGLQRENDGLVTCSNEDFENLRHTAHDIGLLR